MSNSEKLTQAAVADGESSEDSYGVFLDPKELRRSLYSTSDKKLKQEKKNKNKNKKYKKQSLPEYLDRDDRLSLYTSNLVCHDIMKHIERFVSLAIAIKETRSLSGLVATLCLYTQTYYDGSYVVLVREFLEEFLAYEEQGDFDWLEMLKTSYTNWQMVVQSSSFNRISTVVSVCTALGMLKHTKLKIGSRALSLFSTSNLKVHHSAVDLIDAVLSTVVHFYERSFVFFRTQDWRVFFVDNEEASAFDDEYFALLKIHDFAIVGDLESRCGVTDDQYVDRLTSLIDKARVAYKKLSVGFEKKIYFDRLTKLQAMDVEFEMRRSHGGLREAPLGILVFGPSSVGKSSVVNILNASLLSCFNLGGMERVVTINDIEKHESTMRSNVVSVIIDDVANTSSQFVQNSPTERIIRYVNNIISTANMAEVELKGRVQIRPKILFATSNVWDVGAHTYSEEPVSVLRRMSIIITVKVRPEYQIRATSGLSSDMLDTAKITSDDVIQDLWLFDVKRCVGIPDPRKGSRRPDQIHMEFHEFEGKNLENTDIFTLIRFVNSFYAVHTRQQKRLVRGANKLYSEISICGTCRGAKCVCMMDQQSGFDVFQPQVERAILLYKCGIDYYGGLRVRSYQAWRFFQLFVNWRHFLQLYKPTVFMGCYTVFCLLLALTNYTSVAFVLWLFAFIAYCELVYALYCDATSYTLQLPNLSAIFSNLELRHMRSCLVVGSIITTLYTMCKSWRAARRFSAQGNLQPTTYEDVVERDEEASDWSKVYIAPLPVSHKSMTTTHSQFRKMLENNLCHIRTDGGSEMNILFVRSNLGLVPGHMLDQHPTKKVKGELICTFTRMSSSYTRGTFRARLSRTYSYSIPNIDVRVVWVPNAPSFKDITAYLPLFHGTALNAALLKKDSGGEVRQSLVRAKPQGNTFDYDLDYPTYYGLCGAVLYSLGTSSTILGIHVAGVTGQVHGRAACVLQRDITAAEEYLHSVPGYCGAVSEGTMPTKIYEKQFFVGAEIHPKDPVNYLDSGSTIECYGSVIGRSTARSEVCVTPISQWVTIHTGVANEYGPPKFKGPNGSQPWHPWREALNVSGQTTIGLPGDLLSKCVEDYRRPLLDLLTDQSWWKKELIPLTEIQNVSGIDGRKFIPPIALNTSVGYPLTGTKQKYVIDVDDHGEHMCPRNVDPIFWNEAYRMEELYMHGERAYPIFKGCLKDEPTKTTKDKVRVFQACPLAFQLLVRKYYLPILRFLAMNPLVSECAIGINAHGPEWDQLVRHVCKYGDTHILAGDYKKYDLTMSPQIMFASFSIYIDIARECGYTERDLRIMEALATDVCYPVIAYNGTLVSFLGTQPSGQPLTAALNSTAGSLLVRGGYFSLVPHAPPFRERVSLITYGDDNEGSVHENVREYFNHRKFSNFLSTIGLEYTMPDKRSVAVDFLKHDQVDFLKRRSRFSEELQHFVAPLDENSIFKSLHTVVRSSALSLEEQSAQNIDNALREWYYHGREIYRVRLIQMRSVARDAGIAHLCTHLNKHFDYWTEEWLYKYMGQAKPVPYLPEDL